MSEPADEQADDDIRATTTLTGDEAQYFARVRDEVGPDASKSETLRECVRRARDGAARVDELEQRVAKLEAEKDDLRRQLREVNAREDDVEEIVGYVEEERTAQQRWREAGIVRKAKWTLTGVPRDEED
jgi:plasmid stabilization system protein ParE